MYSKLAVAALAVCAATLTAADGVKIETRGSSYELLREGKPAREAAKEIDSTVPWIGFPVGYAVSGVLLTVFGYFAMIL